MMTETRNRRTDDEPAAHPQSTTSTLILISVLTIVTVVFLVAGFADLQPLMTLFHWLALVF